MYFSDLKANLEQLKKGLLGLEQINRQQIYLSDYARSVLLQDMDVFFRQLNIEPGSSVLNSTIINHIFCDFWEDADASIFRSCEKKRAHLQMLLSGLDESLSEQAIVPLIKSHRESIEEQVQLNLSRKGTPITIRISRKNLENLNQKPFPDWNEALQKPERGLYRDKVGNYLKAVIEEYARKPYVEREAIFCKDTLDTIRKAIRLGLILKVTTQGRYVQYVRPYAIQPDAEQMYHYLSGYLSSESGENWRMGSIRLSAITGCEIFYDSSEIGAEQAAELEATIRKKGIQFLLDTTSREIPEKIVVEFTNEGKKMYHKMLHLRPMHDGDPNGLIYSFTTTQRQAENYFFKFGHHVKILEPQTLADKFRRKYESAAKQYQQNK